MNHVFTSDLTIDEALLVEEVGFEPVELVLGSSYFHIGWQGAPWSTNMELVDVGRMMLHARKVAMTRLLEQAARVEADGVVGMRIDIHRQGSHAEFMAMGTAVRRRDKEGRRWHTKRGLPFTCDLSGADFWALVRAGFRPVTLAHGVCVYHVAHQSVSGWLKSLAQQSWNQEQPQYTQALYEARELAMGRMQAEAYEEGATAGVVAVEVREGSHGWGSHVLELVAVGTGVAALELAPQDLHEAPRAVLVAQDA